jgi:hypothetical protein
VACNFETGNKQIKLLTGYENVTQNVLFGHAVLAAFLSGRKYDIPKNVFSKRSPLSKRSVVTELSVEKTHYQIKLSDVG